MPDLPAKPSTAPTARAPANDAAIRAALGSGVWDWRLLSLHGWPSLVVPWPLPWILYLVPGLRSHFRRGARRGWTRSNTATTIAILWCVVGTMLATGSPEAFGAVDPHWDMLANTLIMGATIIAGLMGVSIALPGSSLLRLTVEKDAMAVAEYVVPYMWAFYWCCLGAMVSVLHYCKVDQLLAVAVPWQLSAFVVMFAFVSLFQALMATFRGFAFGVYLAGREKQMSSPGAGGTGAAVSGSAKSSDDTGERPTN